MILSDTSIKPVSTWKEALTIVSEHIKSKFNTEQTLQFLEAGCGRRWGLDLEKENFTLTGIDIDKNALNIRKNQSGDLDIAIHGDLRTFGLGENSYDIIYCSNMLEHVDGAIDVLNNFIRSLKPGGMLVLTLPNRDSAKGFLTRFTPFWFHIIYKKYVMGAKNAGKPGYDPYPVYFDKVVSRKGIHEFCKDKNLIIRAEYYMAYGGNMSTFLKFSFMTLLWIVHVISLGRLSDKFLELIFVIERPRD
jgi:SAM-dependent methyltransferase